MCAQARRLGLVGESGCGKSTTGRMIVGLDQPTAGAIAFRGQDLAGLSAKEWRAKRRDLQIVFQNPQSALDPRLTIRRQIREPLDLHRIGTASEREATVAVASWRPSPCRRELGDRFPHEISGGQAQRVVIARALTLKPSLIVCDEPVSALDVSVQAKVIALLEDLQARLRRLLPVHLPRPAGREDALSPGRGDVSRADRRGGSDRRHL